jgi:methionyl-tRNA formyltransferase
MRVLFFGTSEFAVPSLDALAARRHDVVLCVTQPDRRQGRGLSQAPSPVKRRALELGLPLIQPERVRADAVASARPEVGVALAYGQLIPRDVLEGPPHGVLGVHPSLLPKYRGAAPVAWAILKGERETGMTIFRLNERLDAGDVVWQRAVAIEPGETAEALTRRLSHLGAEGLIQALEGIASGTAKFIPQDEARASLAPKLTKAQGIIDWRAPADQIERHIRAVVPWPGATTAWRGTPVKVWTAAVSRGAGAAAAAEPGTVVSVGSEALTVAAGQGSLDLLELQLPGCRRMTTAEFLAGHPVHIGERLGGRGRETGGGGERTRT